VTSHTRVPKEVLNNLWIICLVNLFYHNWCIIQPF